METPNKETKYIVGLDTVKIINPNVCGFYIPVQDFYKSPYSVFWIEKRGHLIQKAKNKIAFKNKVIINAITFLAFVCAVFLAFLFAYFLGESSFILGAAMGLAIFALRMNLEMKYETNIRFIHLARRGKNYW